MSGTKNCVDNVPVIDLSNAEESEIIEQISKACQTYGFFQVINHGILDKTLQELRSAMKDFFICLPQTQKDALRRSERNSRGYFDDELTKQKRDWKECLDVGTPGSGDWNVLPDSHPQNSCLEGYNQFPSDDTLPHFRSKIIQYFQACESLSHKIATYMSLGLGLSQEGVGRTTEDNEAMQLVDLLRKDHTSFLRLNYYPPCANNNGSGNTGDEVSIMGISPHTDAGFLTILLQDDGCHSLQVALQRQLVDNVGSSLEWMTVHPIPGALTVNTGDMCTIWSNGLYKAPLHRVLTNTEKTRFSAPFFYNPPYRAVITPLPSLLSPQDQDSGNERHPNGALYTHPCAWGYFRAIRFAGDLTDFGTEIQISDYAKGSTSEHPIKQEEFMNEVDFNQPFSIEKYWFNQSKRNIEEASMVASGMKPFLSINSSESLKVTDELIVLSQGQNSHNHDSLKGNTTDSNSSIIITY
jgi:isopenicillin N synthase-like dioxygenase